MMVTFISQCQKNAHKKTRRVLDSFADRIGDNVWQTVITREGLAAVRKLLRKTASKHTAVSCHRFRSRTSSELVWIVGRKDSFDLQGRVPVNSTQVNRTHRDDRADWVYLPLIKAVTALAALFHDWGKANQQFQSKLQADSGKAQGDALRHEFISCLLLKRLIGDSATDQQWLERMAQGELSSIDQSVLDKDEKPLTDLPFTAQILSWLVLSHHRLPYVKSEWSSAPELSDLADHINREWGYFNPKASHTLDACFHFESGLLADSRPWLKKVQRWAGRLLQLQPQLEHLAENGMLRLFLHHCRLSLMLADHRYSSEQVNGRWKGATRLIANTRSYKAGNKKGFIRTREPNQFLDQHLLGVCEYATKNIHLLPQMEKHAPVSTNTSALKKKSPAAFQWQDKAVQQIKNWKTSEADFQQQGFFAVNMASTGCGKTFANAKVMRCLSEDGNSLRYILALGLRTLTLQTGDEYREKIFHNSDGSDLAVLIGSKAVQELHASNKQKEQQDSIWQQSGSESSQPLLDGQDEVIYEGDFPEDSLETALKTRKDKAFFYAPVLACTIDHLMAAVTTRRGGRYILPSLRLMSSDLVIDEIDDFTGDDSKAIGWLIHLAGMLGRKVMISSATIPPAMAEGYFKAYQAGWKMFASMRNKSQKVGCAWIDEFKTQVVSVYKEEQPHLLAAYQGWHQKFVAQRIRKLAQQIAKRRAAIIQCAGLLTREQSEKRQAYHQVILQAALDMHQQHCWQDPESKICISFGVIRRANINPAIALTQDLLDFPVNDDTCVRVMPYHSQQVLLLRNAQEQHLDTVLKRKEQPDQQPEALNNLVIKQHISAARKQGCTNLVFILVATPVEEVGRDHDFDWAIIEPSSYRSLVQMAGRVRRHRNNAVETPNIGILQYNWKTLEGKEQKKEGYFIRPGYETGDVISIDGKRKTLKFKKYDVSQLVDTKSLGNKLDATPRISNKLTTKPLAAIEHAAIQYELCDSGSVKPKTLHGYLSQSWYLTSICQHEVIFRRHEKSTQLCLVVDDDESCFFISRDESGKPDRLENGELLNAEKNHNIERMELTAQHNERLWLQRDYHSLLEQQAEWQNISLFYASLRYGEMTIREDDTSWYYNNQFGLFKNI